ncbi:MAG: isoprenylcysteine carboxylmethyltransferase family protein [Candidatus Omnitrophota bacterium]|nr:isoprenylcysteine carboxylmethyltransferase family protein [Candidatus Omnitrophota bacterium]MBU1929856.1 isoprenylcysteine carboxylmethyltransferase family protein [Candidatus Omnitrophota bacterium]MBU2034667.1 isoprenylcysteine carboxylmethyltransferase family protein [Candidatus Omnitrophota bacterium]MBU2221991.1 isoprenylcysteine carboxylmethyltransferase family protein [Candidatus Omnitrophota bacterium]MBU2258226.1 isoprenylcysteine carboxylmethyltransferase family protein [Candidat
MKIRLKVNGIIMVLSCFLVAFFPAFFFRRLNFGTGDEIMEITGISCILLGQIFRVSARGYKSDNSKEGRALIAGGPYALVRNPMYLGILLIGLGVVLMLFNWWVAVIFLTVFVIRYIFLIFIEEKKLEGLFSKDFLEYKKKVPRIFPTLKQVLKSDMREYLPIKLTWIKKEIGSMLALLFIVLLVESWRDIMAGGIEVYLWEAQRILALIALFIGLVAYLSKSTKHAPDKS